MNIPFFYLAVKKAQQNQDKVSVGEDIKPVKNPAAKAVALLVALIVCAGAGRVCWAEKESLEQKAKTTAMTDKDAKKTKSKINWLEVLAMANLMGGIASGFGAIDVMLKSGAYNTVARDKKQKVK